jgi:PAS domain S-box-containing protein
MHQDLPRCELASSPESEMSLDQGFSYRELVEQAQTGMFIVQDEMLTYANQKLLEMVGFARNELVNVRKASSIIHPKDRSRFEEHVRQRFAGIAGVAYEVQCERADGSLFDARVYGRLVTQRGRPADLITFSDVTELTQATERIKRSYLTSIKVFSNLIELRGGQLVGHGRRVADLARAVAKALGCTADQVQDIFVAGLLHDVGMIGLSDASFEKTVPKLNEAELATYKQHATTGEQSLMALDEMQTVAKLIRSHHERFDGDGFPDGLRGDEIPLGARILAICDSHDDLLCGHMGAPRLTGPEAIILLRHGRGSRFDPEVLAAFLRLIEEPSKQGVASVPLILQTGDLRPGMVLAADLVSPGGVMMLSTDHVLTADMIQRIQQFERREGTCIELRIVDTAKA